MMYEAPHLLHRLLDVLARATILYLNAQIAAKVLPAPEVDCTNNARTIYMIEFPPNVTVT